MNHAESSTSGAPTQWPPRKVEMTEDDLRALMLGFNCASNAMEVLQQHPEIEIRDLDGDPFPEARDRWWAAILEAHKAISRISYAGVAKRRYAHDCDACSFIGKLRQYDMYVCPQGGHPTIVARYGDDGPEYLSGADLRLHDLLLTIKLEKEDV